VKFIDYLEKTNSKKKQKLIVIILAINEKNTNFTINSIC